MLTPIIIRCRPESTRSQVLLFRVPLIDSEISHLRQQVMKWTAATFFIIHNHNVRIRLCLRQTVSREQAPIRILRADLELKLIIVVVTIAVDIIYSLLKENYASPNRR